MQIFPRQNLRGEQNREQWENKRRRGTWVSAVISGAAKIGCSYKDIGGGRVLALGSVAEGGACKYLVKLLYFVAVFCLFCREIRTFSTRALSRDSGWDPVTAIHCAVDGIFCYS